METELGLKIIVPSIAKKQTNRINVPFSTHEEYYSGSAFIPLLDTIISNLESRSSVETLDNFKLSIFFATKLYGKEQTTIR